MTGLVLAAVLLLFAAPVRGDMQVWMYNGVGGGAGEFDVDSVGTTPIPFITSVTHNGHDFITFCVEKRGPLDYEITYDVVLNHAAVVQNGGGPPDPLDPMTAFLYAQFAQGTLSSYMYGGTYTQRHDSANELQEAIWYIEDESTRLSGQAQSWYNLAATAVAVNGDWYNQWGPDSIGNVRVMNLFEEGYGANAEYNIQDQLVMIPAPGAALLGAIALGILGIVKRRLD